MAHRRPSMQSLFSATQVACIDLKKVKEPIHTGIGFFDHMMDQINSHAQIGVGLTIHHHSDFSTLSNKHQHHNNPPNIASLIVQDDDLDIDDDDDDDEGKRKKASGDKDDDGKVNGNSNDNAKKDPVDTFFKQNPNRLSSENQASLLRHVGWTIGSQVALLPKFLGLEDDVQATSRFCCSLDEALVECVLTKPLSQNKRRKTDGDSATNSMVLVKPVGSLTNYELAPFGKYPKSTGRTKIGHLETAALEEFFKAFAKSSGLEISLKKLRGDNGHHIVESTFKAFSRAMRNLLDGTDTREATLTSKGNMTREATFQQAMWGPTSKNWKESLALQRSGKVERSTKETKIEVALKLDGGSDGVSINTGIATLDEFFTVLAKEACLSLKMDCKGDLWVDDHHTSEDVSIALGQVLTQALGTKAGLNRMWCARQMVPGTHKVVEVTMDLSNRPCLTHNLPLAEFSEDELMGDLSVEMLDHVLDSLVVNGRMTTHIVLSTLPPQLGDDQDANGNKTMEVECSLKDIAMATAAAFGKALKYCAMVDYRRAGQTASSKGTLSV